MAAYCDMALLFFIENEPPLPEVKHRASGFFFCPGWFQLFSKFFPSLFQLYSNFSQLFGKTELFKITLKPCNYLKALYIKCCSNFIGQKIQLNRAKWHFNRTKKKKPNICFARCPAVSDSRILHWWFTSEWINRSVRKSDFQKCTIWNWTQYSNLSEKLTGSIF